MISFISSSEIPTRISLNEREIERERERDRERERKGERQRERDKHYDRSKESKNHFDIMDNSKLKLAFTSLYLACPLLIDMCYAEIGCDLGKE